MSRTISLIGGGMQCSWGSVPKEVEAGCAERMQSEDLDRTWEAGQGREGAYIRTLFVSPVCADAPSAAHEVGGKETRREHHGHGEDLERPGLRIRGMGKIRCVYTHPVHIIHACRGRGWQVRAKGRAGGGGYRQAHSGVGAMYPRPRCSALASILRGRISSTRTGMVYEAEER
jgi:hypothetical protein